MRTAFLCALATIGLLLAPTGGFAQSQYPMMDKLSDRVIQKYESSSCQQIAAQRAQRPTGRRAAMEQRVIQMLHQDPQMRQEFLNRVAAPIANKLFECGIIP